MNACVTCGGRGTVRKWQGEPAYGCPAGHRDPRGNPAGFVYCPYCGAREVDVPCPACEARARLEGPWFGGAMGRDPRDFSLVWRDDAATGAQFMAASPRDAEHAARILNELERKLVNATDITKESSKP